MRLEVGVDALHANQLGVHELEGLKQPARRLLGRVQEGDGSLVGGRFLVLPVGEHHAHRRVGSAEGGPHAELPEIAGADGGACRHGGEAEKLEHQRRRLRPRDLVPQSRKMAAGDMAAFVRDHADDLVGGLGFHQRAGMDEHIVPIDDEGVEGAVVDDVDVDGLSAQARGVQDRLGIGADQRFSLGIADHAAGLGRGRAHERNDQTADRGAAKVSQGAR